MTKRIIFTMEQIEEAMENNNGFCLACGEERAECEPDACGYDCEVCGKHEVVGAASVLLMGLVKEEAA